jgi:hypothetical protein
VVLGLFATLLLSCGLLHRDLSLLKAGVPRAAPDPPTYRRRLALGFLPLVAAFALISRFHVRDAIERGEPVLGAVLGIVLSGAVVAGTFLYFLRGRPANVGARSQRILRFIAPITGAVALARLVALFFGR